MESPSFGATIFGLTASGWPIHIRDTFPIMTPAKMGMSESRPSLSTYPINTAYMTWREMCGSGRATGTGPDYYKQLAETGGVARDPQGPEASYDPAEPNEPKKVHRGGSYLCTDQYCSRYIVGTRGKGEVSTGTNHLGFRCVMKR